jgi:hypothetical protein
MYYTEQQNNLLSESTVYYLGIEALAIGVSRLPLGKQCDKVFIRINAAQVVAQENIDVSFWKSCTRYSFGIWGN